MSPTLTWALACLLAWLILAPVVVTLLGRMLRRRDEQLRECGCQMLDDDEDVAT